GSENSSADRQTARTFWPRCEGPDSRRVCDNRHNAYLRTAERGRSRLLYLQADGSGKCRRCWCPDCVENLRPERFAGNHKLFRIERRDYVGNPQHFARNGRLSRLGVSNRGALLPQFFERSAICQRRVQQAFELLCRRQCQRQPCRLRPGASDHPISAVVRRKRAGCPWLDLHKHDELDKDGLSNGEKE